MRTKCVRKAYTHSQVRKPVSDLSSPAGKQHPAQLGPRSMCTAGAGSVPRRAAAPDRGQRRGGPAACLTHTLVRGQLSRSSAAASRKVRRARLSAREEPRSTACFDLRRVFFFFNQRSVIYWSTAHDGPAIAAGKFPAS